MTRKTICNVRRVIPYAIWERHVDERLHPHTAPDDAEFPAPTDWDSCQKLMDRFPRRQQVAFALIAAEMALPHFELWVQERTDFTPAEKKQPRATIAVGWAWVNGEANDKEIKLAADSAWAIKSKVWNVYYAAAAAYAAAAYAYAATAYAAADSAHAAHAASVASVAYAYVAAKQFYAEWWRQCRSRLAFADVLTCEFDVAENREAVAA